MRFIISAGRFQRLLLFQPGGGREAGDGGEVAVEGGGAGEAGVEGKGGDLGVGVLLQGLLDVTDAVFVDEVLEGAAVGAGDALAYVGGVRS